MDAFVQAFATVGYVLCDDGELEPNTEKVVIYADADGLPTHAARQLPFGLWTSKLGQLEDISHHTLDSISGTLYGTPRQFLQRQKI